MPKVHFINELVSVDVPVGTTIREVAIQQGIQLYRGMWTHLNCLGNGICGRCLIWVMAEGTALSSPSLRERFHRVAGKQRLACQVRVQQDMEIRTRPIGPATVREGSEQQPPSYRAAAEARYREALAEAARQAEAAEAAPPKTGEESA